METKEYWLQDNTEHMKRVYAEIIYDTDIPDLTVKATYRHTNWCDRLPVVVNKVIENIVSSEFIPLTAEGVMVFRIYEMPQDVPIEQCVIYKVIDERRITYRELKQLIQDKKEI